LRHGYARGAGVADRDVAEALAAIHPKC
jgi:hypothetical protein